jgi:hypothetical protein
VKGEADEMSMKEQVLVFNPGSSLLFVPSHEHTTFLKISNPIGKPVCFKVKTTDSKRYHVKPRSGVILPNSCINLQFKRASPDEVGAKPPKFKVLSCVMTSPEADLNTFWDTVPPEDIMETKLSSVYFQSDNNSLTGGLSQFGSIAGSEIDVQRFSFVDAQERRRVPEPPKKSNKVLVAIFVTLLGVFFGKCVVPTLITNYNLLTDQ